VLRFLGFVVLLCVLGAVGLFVLQNQEAITLQYLDRSATCSPALLSAVAYLLGVVSGGTVLGLARRSLRRARDRPPG
jgi:hypothetical protein